MTINSITPSAQRQRTQPPESSHPTIPALANAICDGTFGGRTFGDPIPEAVA
tara:strand:+ start:318 stop:473 length:156 start_codon:yes stop_codon:yes gene_type:complete